MPTSIFRRYPSRRLESAALYEWRQNNAAQNIGQQFFEASTASASFSYVGTGGAQSGGAADIQAGGTSASSYEYVGTGGAQSGGAAGVQAGIAYVGTGGAQSGGTAGVVFSQSGEVQSVNGKVRVQVAAKSSRVQVGGGTAIRVQSLSEAA